MKLGCTRGRSTLGYCVVVGSSNIEEADHARHEASAQSIAARFRFAALGIYAAGARLPYRWCRRTKLARTCKLVLGGDTRPRGYVSAFFRGSSGFAASAELRTSAVNLWSARVGGVAFYDVGGTGEAVKDIVLHQSVGAGVRILFPQLNRQVFRLDWAAPLTAGRGRIPDRARYPAASTSLSAKPSRSSQGQVRAAPGNPRRGDDIDELAQ